EWRIDLFRYILILSAAPILMLFNTSVLPQDFKTPSGINIFSQAEIIDQFVGNTAYNKMYAEYYLLPETGTLRGKLRGKSQAFGVYEGSWYINGALFCIKYDKRIMSSRSDCYTVATQGENTRIYRMDGYELYPDGGRLRVDIGNPRNL
ncbi:MAG: hypothetical protein AAF353_10870, partial [Pseudomonadota bacterium]